MDYCEALLPRDSFLGHWTSLLEMAQQFSLFSPPVAIGLLCVGSLAVLRKNFQKTSWFPDCLLEASGSSGLLRVYQKRHLKGPTFRKGLVCHRTLLTGKHDVLQLFERTAFQRPAGG